MRNKLYYGLGKFVEQMLLSLFTQNKVAKGKIFKVGFEKMNQTLVVHMYLSGIWKFGPISTDGVLMNQGTVGGGSIV